MMFVVLAETLEYSPKRCRVVVYKRGQKGCLPEAFVRAAEARGDVEVLGHV